VFAQAAKRLGGLVERQATTVLKIGGSNCVSGCRFKICKWFRAIFVPSSRAQR